MGVEGAWLTAGCAGLPAASSGYSAAVREELTSPGF